MSNLLIGILCIGASILNLIVGIRDIMQKKYKWMIIHFAIFVLCMGAGIWNFIISIN